MPVGDLLPTASSSTLSTGEILHPHTGWRQVAPWPERYSALRIHECQRLNRRFPGHLTYNGVGAIMAQNDNDGVTMKQAGMLKEARCYTLTRMLPSKLVIVAALLCLASLSGACVAVPSSPSQPDGAPQNAPPTPEFSTTQVPSDLQAAPEPAAAGDCPGLDSTLAEVVSKPRSPRAGQAVSADGQGREDPGRAGSEPGGHGLLARITMLRSARSRARRCRPSCRRAGCAIWRKRTRCWPSTCLPRRSRSNGLSFVEVFVIAVISPGRVSDEQSSKSRREDRNSGHPADVIRLLLLMSSLTSYAAHAVP